MTDEKLVFNGTVNDNGQITLPRRLKGDVAKAFSGKEIVVTFQRKRRPRSLDQNAYFHGPVLETAVEGFAHLGHLLSPDEAKDFLKRRFLTVYVYDPETGELKGEYSRGTSDLKVHEFSFFLDNCIQFLLEFTGYQVPEPRGGEIQWELPEHQKPKESRAEYLERIRGYAEDIFDTGDLRKYFNQNPDWKEDEEVRAIFRARHNAIIGKIK